MKKTFCIAIEDQEVMIEIMGKMAFEEINRVATGGMMSNAGLLITFDGPADNYNELLYAERKQPNSIQFFSLKEPYWRTSTSLEEYINTVFNKISDTYEIKSL